MEIDLKTAEGGERARLALLLSKYTCLEVLLRHGVSPDSADELGESLCHLAARKGDIIALTIIIGFGPDMLKTDILQEIPVFAAIRSLENRIINFVWEWTKNQSAILNHQTRNGYTIAHYAAAYANPDLLRKIIHLGTKHLAVKSTQKGYTPLHIAASKGSAEIIQLLIEHSRIQLTTADKFGRYPIHYAFHEGAIQVFEKENPAWLKVPSRVTGNTVIHYAAIKGYPRTIVSLINRIPGLKNVKNSQGETWIDLASAKTIDKVKTYCLEAGKEHGQKGFTKD